MSESAGILSHEDGAGPAVSGIDHSLISTPAKHTKRAGGVR